MDTYNGDLSQTLKWLQNEAPKITGIINDAQTWREKNTDQFFSNWQTSVFNLDTCNIFGIVVWCAILGVSNDIVDVTPIKYPFAFGKYRQNFQAPSDSTLTYPNTIGGNFFGNTNAVTGIEEARFLLKLRYAALVSNGRFIFINRMLNWIINKGDKLQSPDNNIIVVDKNANVTPAITDDNYWEYRIGKNVTLNGKALSGTLINVLNERSNGVVPCLAGVKYTFVQES